MPRRSSWALVLVAALVASCGGSNGPAPNAPDPPGDPGPAPDPPPAPAPAEWNLDSLGVPRFVDHDYIDLARIRRISRFRSAEGHDYSDMAESCRSMKHYYVPAVWSEAHTIPIHSPVDGVVTRIFDEWAGTQVQIQPHSHPAFTIVLFHVALAAPLAEGDSLARGQVLGAHVGSQTSSDVAVRVAVPGGWRLVSWMDVLTDGRFGDYVARGVPVRDSLVLTREARDADPLTCDGAGQFVERGALPGWYDLQ